MFPLFQPNRAWRLLQGFVLAISLWGLASLPVAAQYATETVLHNFNGHSGDGNPPYATLVQGPDGNFYGTSAWGGDNFAGAVYKITPTGEMSIVYSFGSKELAADGSGAFASLILSGDGNFYGTTAQGGTYYGGTIFRVTPSGQEAVLYSFAGNGTINNPNPYNPNSVMIGQDGNFYGTTYLGGAYNGGTIFQVTPSGQETTLHSFYGTDINAPSSDGFWPSGGLIQDKNGNFYGVTQYGGTGAAGTVFKLTPDGTETLLHSFTDVPDGKYPTDNLLQAPDGNFYGTTMSGGAYGQGTVYKITPDGTETILYSFTGTDGANPVGGVILGSDGSFYGTTAAPGAGTVYKLTPDGTHILLATFAKQPGGIAEDSISAGLVQGTDGNFYGTVNGGGNAVYGIVFRLSLPPSDFNGDGKPDLLFQNPATGQMAVWFMNGTSPEDGAFITPTQDLAWKAVGVAAFHADGHPDILFQNRATGQLAVWLMNGASAISGQYLNGSVPAGWKAVSIADFNGDGYPDILFQNASTGQMALWYLQETKIIGNANVTITPASGWQALGAGDFNKDGHPDVVLQNTSTGQLAVWFMNNNTPTNGAYILPAQQAGWRCVSVVDLNGDGWPDLVFQNTSTGKLVYWLLNGMDAVDGNAFRAQPPAGWEAGGSH